MANIVFKSRKLIKIKGILAIDGSLASVKEDWASGILLLSPKGVYLEAKRCKKASFLLGLR